MMGVLSWLTSKKEPEDYEQILSSLALDIQKRQTRLSEMRLRERRTTLLVTLYTLAAWGLYVALWYTGFVPNLSQHPRQSGFEKFAKGIPLVLGPVIIQFTRRIVQTWYTRIENAEEKTLKELYAKQRSKVEEIKKKTNYYTTRDLLERYDGPGSPGSPAGLRQRQNVPRTPVKQPAPLNIQRGPARGGLAAVATPVRGAAANGVAGAPEPTSPTPVAPLVPPRKQWYDKVADALLGDDEFSSNNPASRYALVCQKCFAHNGLVRESMYEETQYVCPKCGHFNPSIRSQRSAATPRSTSQPWSPQSTTRSPAMTPSTSANLDQADTSIEAPPPSDGQTQARSPLAKVTFDTPTQDDDAARINSQMDVDGN